MTKTEERPKSVALRLFQTLLGHLDLRAPRAWNRFGAYLELLAGFITMSAEDVEKEIETGKSQPLQRESEAYKIGMEYAFKEGLLSKFGDFMLQEDSPLHDRLKPRPKMGSTTSLYGSSSKPNFTPLL